MTEHRKISVVIVDDHPLFRQGLGLAIKMDPRFELVGEAETGTQAVDVIMAFKPDIAVLDLNLPGLSGLDVATVLHAKKSKTHIVVLTVQRDEATINKALNLGVMGYVLKENAIVEIMNCIVAVSKNEAYVSPSLTNLLLRRRHRAEALEAHQPGIEDLTLSERRVLRRIADGRTTKEIATELFISPRTVESHRANIATKLDLHGTNKLIQFALENRDALAHLT